MLHEKLRVYRQSIELAGGLSKESAKWPKGYGYLADQLRRAMASVVLNLAEGNTRRSHIERRRFFEISRASASEVGACVDLMFAFGLIDQIKLESFKLELIEISKILWALSK